MQEVELPPHPGSGASFSPPASTGGCRCSPRVTCFQTTEWGKGEQGHLKVGELADGALPGVQGCRLCHVPAAVV